VIEVTVRTLVVGFAATALLLPLATAVGWWLARGRSRLRPLVSLVVTLPLVLPPVVIGWLLLAVFGRPTPVGGLMYALGLGLPFTPLAATVAAAVVGLPLAVASSRAAFEAVDVRLEEVSQACGEPPWRCFWRVTVPLAAPGLAAGAVLAFARAIGEFGATMVFAGDTPWTRTLAIAVYAGLDDPGGPSVVPWVLASGGLGAAALLGHEALVRWQRRRLEVDDR
jgi:molybdate transport system permease protein